MSSWPAWMTEAIDRPGEMGVGNGDIVKAKKERNRVVIEPLSQMNATAPHRGFSDAEIDEFLVADTIEELMKL